MRWTANFVRAAFCVTLALGGSWSGVSTAAAAGVAKSAGSLYERARAADERLQKSSKLKASKRAWVDVAQRYHRVVLTHPRSGYCDDALFYEGQTYRELDKRFRDQDAVRRALDAYLLLVSGYPSSKWVSAAHLARADLLLNRRADAEAAKKELRTVVHRWPGSQDAAEARRVLAKLDLPARPPAASGGASNGSDLVEVSNIRHWTGKQYTRIVIDMGSEVRFSRGRLTSPDRIYFDLFDTRLSSDLASRTFPVGDGFLKQIRVGQNKPKVVRVVLDFEDISRYNVFSLPDPYRLVVDILGIKPEDKPQTAETTNDHPVATAAGETTAASSPDAEPSLGSPGEQAPVVSAEAGGAAPVVVDANAADVLTPLPPDPTRDGRFPLSRQLGLSARRVIIDPGHGGQDPGTIGRNGISEKDLVLDISHRVAKLLQQDGEFEVLMTRKDDVFIPLEERTAIANSQAADLFVSIHANASRNRGTRGIETYYLNLAMSPEAELVAARENAVSTGRLAELQGLLKQIMNNSKIAESRDFAHRVQESLVSNVVPSDESGRNLGVKTAPFYVLLGANMPAVLVEVSFLSNQRDASLLSTEAYRQELAESIAAGIRQYTSSLKRIARVPAEEILSGGQP